MRNNLSPRAHAANRAHRGTGARQPATPSRRPSRNRHRTSRRPFGLRVAFVVGVAVLALGVIFALTHSKGSPAAGQAGQYRYAVGQPGPGALAPAIHLASTSGGTFDLSAMRGKSVLLYFQEGLYCEPCWTQLKDIQKRQGDFAGMTIISITTDPLDALKQKVADEGISIPVLSDPQLAVSQAYHANSYGMMGASRDGHTFILVGPDSRIQWRADYGGAPDYTMYVPVANLVADMRKGMAGGTP